MTAHSPTHWEPTREEGTVEPHVGRRWLRWLSLLIGLGLGLAVGLVYTWVLNPVQFYNTVPADLRSEYKEQWILLAAAAYRQDGDLDRALVRLSRLNDDKIGQTVTELTERYIQTGKSAARIRVLAALADALGARTDEMLPYLIAPSPAVTDTPAATPTPVPSETPADTPVSTPMPSPTLVQPDTPTYTPTSAPAASPTPSPTLVQPDTPTPSPTLVPPDTPTPTPTATPTPSPTLVPPDTPMPTPTATPTPSPTLVPPDTPMPTPTASPTLMPPSTPTDTPPPVTAVPPTPSQ
jgi:hypothetical protein